MVGVHRKPHVPRTTGTIPCVFLAHSTNSLIFDHTFLAGSSLGKVPDAEAVLYNVPPLLSTIFLLAYASKLNPHFWSLLDSEVNTGIWDTTAQGLASHDPLFTLLLRTLQYFLVEPSIPSHLNIDGASSIPFRNSWGPTSSSLSTLLKTPLSSLQLRLIAPLIWFRTSALLMPP